MGLYMFDRVGNICGIWYFNP